MPPVDERAFGTTLRDLELECNRASDRKLVCLEVVLRGRGGAFEGRTIDVSRHGALVEIPKFEGARQDVVRMLEEIDARFGTGGALSFIEAEITVHCDLVRAAPATHGTKGAWLLAFRFRAQLTRTQVRALGVR